MSAAFVTGVQLVNPGEEIRSVSISFDEDGRITGMGPSGKGDCLLDGGGELYVLPGFIDIHTHGANGADFSDARDGALEVIAEAKLKEGVTTFLPTTWTTSRENLEGMARAAARYRANQIFARTPFLHVEGPYLNPRQAGAQDPNTMRPPDADEIRRIHSLCPVGLVSLAVELEGACDFIRQMAALGIRCSAAHSAATHREFLRAKEAGLVHLTHFCNQMSPLHHREIGLVGSGFLDDDIRLELICDTVHLCEEMIALVFKHRSLDRIMLITDSISASHLGDGEYSLGHSMIIVKDGAARIPAGNLAGSTLQFQKALANVARITRRPLHELVRTTALNQASSLGLEDRGILAPGKLADFAFLNRDLEVIATFVGGEPRYLAP